MLILFFKMGYNYKLHEQNNKCFVVYYNVKVGTYVIFKSISSANNKRTIYLLNILVS